jgi:transposase-like protein
MSGKKGSKHYATTVKVEAVRLFLEEGLTYAQIAERLGIRKAERIEIWVRQYRKEGMEAFKKPIGRPRKVNDENAYIARLEMENKLLKKLQSELREIMLAKRDIGQSATTRKNSK